MDDAITNACWQFNEAVSLLRSASHHVRSSDLAEEIANGLPAIQAALEGLAAYLKENAR